MELLHVPEDPILTKYFLSLSRCSGEKQEPEALVGGNNSQRHNRPTWSEQSIAMSAVVW
jgi:hypothetical protein